jgi:aminopeptidase N
MCRAAGVDTSGSMVISQSREILPRKVVPKHYDLTLECDFEKSTFEGTVMIDLAPPTFQLKTIITSCSFNQV